MTNRTIAIWFRSFIPSAANPFGRLTAFTNIGSLFLPREFQFDAYNRPKSPTQTPVLAYGYRGNLIKAYERIAANAFDRGYGTKTLVQDERFISAANPAGYVQHVAITNETVPQTNHPQMVEAAIQASRSQFLATAPPPTNLRWRFFQTIQRARALISRPVLFLFVCGLALFSFVFILARRGESD